MRLLHLDLPRGLSLTLKPWSAKCSAALGATGHGWRQIDLNFDFWRWLLDDEQTDLCGRLADLHFYQPAAALEILRRCGAALSRRGAGLECALEPAGVVFPRFAPASPRALLELVRRTPDQAFFEPYFRRLCQKFMLLSGYSVVSLGVDSADGLVFAALVAEFIHRHDPDLRVCLTRHQYENYSLGARLPELVADGALLQLFDAVVWYEEQAADALAGLVDFFRDGATDALVNVAVVVAGRPTLVPPRHPTPAPAPPITVDPAYLRDTGVPADRLVYFMPLVGAACDHGRCTFCVQNHRYLATSGADPDRQLSRALATIAHLVRERGVTAFSFADQAVSPAALARFAAGLVARGLRPSWCVRMRFDPPAIDDALLATLRRAGCREVLFGLESVRAATRRSMGKGLDVDLAAARDLVARLDRHGLDVVLNLMYGFPLEADADFETTTWRFVEEIAARHRHVTFVLNRFTLFRDTPIEQRPEAFGIALLRPPRGPLDPERDFVDVHGRDSSQPHPHAERYGRAADGSLLADAAWSPADAALVRQAHHSSIGLLYRWRTGRHLAAMAAARAAEPAATFVVTDSIQRDVLVVGSRGYVGAALARAIDPRCLILSSRTGRVEPPAGVDAPYLQQDLERSAGALAELQPREVYVVARPRSPEPEPQARVTAHLVELLRAWALTGRLERVVLLSTQLVYPTPPDGKPLTTASATGPVAPYERCKLELEEVVRSLAARGGVAGEVFRLPLVYGGMLEPAQRGQQLLYAWLDQLRAGARWDFATPAARRYGASWVWLPDLVAALLAPRGRGFHLRQPVSGHFTYAALQRAVAPCAAPDSGARLHLVRSRFFLRDEEGLPRRRLTAMLAAEAGVAPCAPTSPSP